MTEPKPEPEPWAVDDYSHSPSTASHCCSWWTDCCQEQELGWGRLGLELGSTLPGSRHLKVDLLPIMCWLYRGRMFLGVVAADPTFARGRKLSRLWLGEQKTQGPHWLDFTGCRRRGLSYAHGSRGVVGVSSRDRGSRLLELEPAAPGID